MATLVKDGKRQFPLTWANLDYFPDSNGKHREIYLTNERNRLEDLIELFYVLFGDLKKEIKVFQPSWWDYCIDTWNPDADEYDYTLNNKSKATREYLILLQKCSIEIGYSGSCICNDWDQFLHIALQCVILHKAPYSPTFFDEENDYFFYFHHSGSIGLYYRLENSAIRRLLSRAEEEYDIR